MLSVPASLYRARSQQALRTSRRITINERFLDEIRIAMPKDHTRANCLLSFPVGRHWAAVESDRLLIGVQAPTLVQLYFEGFILAGRDAPVTAQIGDQPTKHYVLERVEACERTAADDVIVLHLRLRADPATEPMPEE